MARGVHSLKGNSPIESFYGAYYTALSRGFLSVRRPRYFISRNEAVDSSTLATAASIGEYY